MSTTGHSQPPGPAPEATALVRLEYVGRRQAWATHRIIVWVLLSLALVGALVPAERNPYETCGLKRLTTIPCPFCGATRTYRLLYQGYWQTAWRYSPAMVLLYMGCLTYLGYALSSALTGYVFRVRYPMLWLALLAFAIVLAIILNYAYRLWMTYTGNLPRLPWEDGVP